MIRLRLSSFGNDLGDLQIPIDTEGEILSSALDRLLKEVPLDFPREKVFSVLVDGHFVPPEKWGETRLSGSSEVLVVPNLLSGDPGTQNFFRMAIVIAAAYFAGPLGAELGLKAGTFAMAAFQASVVITASVAAYAIFPPPKVSTEHDAPSIEKSQMYAINGQSNQTRRFDIVPKVYGKHRMFPNVAATPYVELVPDENGKLAQDLYCIYDFGLGPVEVSDIRIGDTPITEYENYEINLFDYKPKYSNQSKPGKADPLSLRLYHGDVSSEQVSVSLERDEERVPKPPEDLYQVVRTTGQNADGLQTEVTVMLVCPQGLSSMSSTGDQGNATVNLKVDFKPFGAPDSQYHSYCDLDYVDSYETLGVNNPQDGVSNFTFDSTFMNWLADNGHIDVSSRINLDTQITTADTSIANIRTVDRVTYKLASNYFFAPEGIFLGAHITFNGVFIGTVVEKIPETFPVSYGTMNGFRYVTDTPLDGKVVEISTLTEITECGYGLSDPLSQEWTCNLPYREFTMWRYDAAFNNGPSSLVRLSDNTRDPKYACVKFRPRTPGQYTVRVKRTSSYSDHSYQILDAVSVIELRTRFDRNPISTSKRHQFLEVKIRATNQLNGTIQNLNALVTSVLDYYDTGTGTWKQKATSNPAWVFCDILTGQINKRPIAKSRLHLPSLLEWASYCDEIPTAIPPTPQYLAPRFQCNMVMDYVTTVKDLIDQITSAAGASMNIVDGKYGVLIDKKKTVPVQVFTPRNSKNFSSTRGFSKQPHGVVVKYISPLRGWQVSEITVYDDGYNADTATELQEATSFACTSTEQAFRFGRNLLAQNRLRKEIITIEVDFEHLVCTRGDYVLLTQDTMKVGGFPARVKSIVGNQITIDDGIVTNSSLTYGFTYRSKTGQIKTNTLTVVNSDTFILNGTDLPQVGDLIIIGETTKITYDCIVRSIEPTSDYGATLTLVEKADAIHDSESGGAIPSYNSGISATSFNELSPPGPVENLAVVANTWDWGSSYQYYIGLDWDVPSGAAYDIFEVYVDHGDGYDLAGFTKSTAFRYDVDTLDLGLLHSMKVVAVSATGTKLDLGSVPTVTATPMKKTSPPSDVESLSIDITGEVLQLSWPAITDPDTKEYLIRYSPSINSSWEASIPLLKVDRNTTLAATQARTGTYFLKAVDFNGNLSANAARAITTIPNLFNLNMISETTDFPLLPGSRDRVQVKNGNLILQESVSGAVGVQQFYSEGFYYYDTLLNLGEIYTVRLQSLIQAEGYTLLDIMENWTPLSSIASLYSPGTSEWDVEAQYRTTDTLNVIADWAPFSDVLLLSAGEEDTWTPWRKIAAITDATGRIFQFRLRLISNQVSVSPRVFDGTIRADMPDRIESYNNLTALDTGYSVVYDPAFKGPTPSPAVQISLESATSGDYWEFTSKTVEGFTVQFYDKNGAPVQRVFDAQVKGYGRKHPFVI